MKSDRAAPDVRLRLVLAACMTALSIGMLEIAVRIAGRNDQDGNFSLGHRQALPLRLPINRLEATVHEYRSSTQALFTDDARLGWKPKALAHNELYAYDRAGLRTRTPDGGGAERRAGAIRIAIFGDSFAHGSEVSFDESWGSRVQQALDRTHGPVDVLNYGVPGYGMDQAFLRWEEEGRLRAPAIVLFGLQLENAARNHNLLRVLYDSADLPFAKPRFIESGDRLDLVNVPVPAPEEVVRIVRTIDQWPLAEYERYYVADSYSDRAWRRSRLAGVLERLIVADRRTPPPDGELPEDDRRLALKIIERFARSVEASGARFVIVHFPRRGDLERARAKGRLPNLDFLESVARIAPLVRIDGALLSRAGEGNMAPLFSPGGHYSPEGYAVLAGEVVERLKPQLLAAGQAARAASTSERTVQR